MTLLLKQFKEGRYNNLIISYNKYIGNKKQLYLNSLIPGIYQNMLQATQQYIRAVMNKNIQYIQKTSANAIKKKLISQIKGINHISCIRQIEFGNQIKQQNKALLISQRKSFSISPYVIFNQKIEKRITSDNPWSSIIPLTTNRYIKLSKDILIINHIYGFQCFYKNEKIRYEIQDKIYPAQQFVVTFQTHSSNYDFYVTDFNFLIKNQLN